MPSREQIGIAIGFEDAIHLLARRSDELRHIFLPQRYYHLVRWIQIVAMDLNELKELFSTLVRTSNATRSASI